MKESIKKGFSFGLASGVITTLGLIIGLYSGTQSAAVIISGILVIAIADATSDALGIHISEESKEGHSEREVWESTIFTFLSKFFFAMTFIIPFLFFQLLTAVVVCVVWGLGLIATLSYGMAKRRGTKPHSVIFEHIIIAVAVILATYYIGGLAA
jgi:VIT1/CCC1 family predicted Fe2+/Mn2+ transporter